MDAEAACCCRRLLQHAHNAPVARLHRTAQGMHACDSLVCVTHQLDERVVPLQVSPRTLVCLVLLAIATEHYVVSESRLTPKAVVHAQLHMPSETRSYCITPTLAWKAKSRGCGR